MTKLLAIKTSLLGEEGNSTQLLNTFLQRWRDKYPEHDVVVRDLCVNPVPHLDAATFKAFATPPDKRSTEQQGLVALSDELIEEFMAADILAIGLPMYNLGVPSTFKAYIDHIARAGLTFRYTEAGSVGLAVGKRLIVLGARGGLYKGTSADVQTPYIKNMFGFLGIVDTRFILAEGVAISPEQKTESLERARKKIAALLEDSQAESLIES